MVDVASAVGVAAIEVSEGVALAVAIVDGEDVGAASSDLWDLEMTISARRTTPKATAKTTRPDGPCFFSCEALGATGTGANTG